MDTCGTRRTVAEPVSEFVTAEHVDFCGLMDVVRINSSAVEKASFAQRLRRLRIAYRSGRVMDYCEVPPGLFAAYTNSTDPDDFLQKRIEGVYPTREVTREAIGHYWWWD
jgi:KTSC domain-containing protein